MIFLCIRCVAMDHGACVCAHERVSTRTQKKCLASFIKGEQLKLHQHKEINQSRAVINNRVIRSLVPQQPIDQMSRHCFIPVVPSVSVTGLGKDPKKLPYINTTHTYFSLPASFSGTLTSDESVS